MAKKILVSYTFEGNEVQNALLHVLAANPTALGAGQVYYNSVTNRVRWYNGTTWLELYTINDVGTSTTDLWSADKIQSAINTAISGGVNYQGGYNAATNTPNLDSSPTAGTLLKGYMYTVTVAGTFFTEPVSIGDVIIIEIDDPAALTDFTIVERNLNTATETSEGTVELATQGEVDAGTAGALVVTAATFQQGLINSAVTKKYAVDLDNAEASVVRAFAGGRTTFTVTHNLGTTDTTYNVKEISTGETVETEADNTAANTMDIIFNGNIADDIYRVTIIG